MDVLQIKRLSGLDPESADLHSCCYLHPSQCLLLRHEALSLVEGSSQGKKDFSAPH